MCSLVQYRRLGEWFSSASRPAILRGMVQGVRIRGPFKGPSGYDNHVRQFVRSLSLRGVSVDLQDIPNWGPAQLPHHLRDPWYESLKGVAPPGSVVHFCFPTQVVPHRGLPNLNFTMFEGTRIPALWAAAHTDADIIVVPTEHSRRAWVKSGVP